MPAFRERIAGLLASASSAGVSLRVNGDSQDRVAIEAGGRITWGSGAAASDLNLQRADVSLARLTGSFVVNNNASGDANSGLRLVSSVATTHTNWRIGAQMIVGGLEFTPSTAAGGTTFSTPSMVILNTSNVGIGTNSPTTKLQVVYGDSIAVNTSSPNTTSALTLSASDPGSIAAGHGVLLQFRGLAARGGVAAIGGVYNSTNKDDGLQLVFYRNSGNSTIAEAARLTSAGNFGIGTSTPAELLEVAGNIRAAAIGQLTFGDADYGIGKGASAGLRMWTQSATDIRFGAGNLASTPWMTLTNGAVGIGTNSPSERLQVIGNARIGQASNSSTNARLEVTSGGSGFDSVIDLGFWDTFDASVWLLKRHGSDGTFRIVNSGTGSEVPVITITNGNNVGIGTTSPVTPLHTSGGPTATAGWSKTATLQAQYPMLIFNSNATKWGGIGYDNTLAMRFWVNASSDDIPAGTLAMSIANSGAITAHNSLTVSNGLTVSGNTAFDTNTLYIDAANDRIGIGTTTIGVNKVRIEGGYLSVNNAESGVGELRIGGVYSQPGIYNDTAGAYLYLNTGPNATGIAFGTNANNVRMFINNTGNVGIGLTSPTERLHVSGNALINGSLSATTKSFDIDHPTKPGQRLRYGSVEAPEHSVQVRGHSTSKEIHLPDYWLGLIDPKTITVQITPVGCYQKLFVEYCDATVIVLGVEDEVNCDYFYMVSAERVDIPKLVVEYGDDV